MCTFGAVLARLPVSSSYQMHAARPQGRYVVLSLHPLRLFEYWSFESALSFEVLLSRSLPCRWRERPALLVDATDSNARVVAVPC